MTKKGQPRRKGWEVGGPCAQTHFDTTRGAGQGETKAQGHMWWLPDPLLCAGSCRSYQTAFALSLTGRQLGRINRETCHCCTLGGIGEAMPPVLPLRIAVATMHAFGASRTEPTLPQVLGPGAVPHLRPTLGEAARAGLFSQAARSNISQNWRCTPLSVCRVFWPMWQGSSWPRSWLQDHLS